MTNIVLLAVCGLIGLLLRVTGKLPVNAASVLNSFVMNVTLPAFILYYIHRVTFGTALIYDVSMSWVFFGLACAVLYPIARWLKLDRASTGAILICTGTCNTSFVGFPMIEAFYSKQDIGIGVIIDQLGNTFVLNTLGLALAASFAGNAVSARKIVQRLASFPAVWALIIALALLPVPYPVWADDVLHRLSDVLIPVAMVSIGFQLHVGHLTGNITSFALGTGFKLVLGPLLILALYSGLFHLSGRAFQIGVFEMAMGPSIAAGIIAIEAGLNPPLASVLVGLGIPLSFLTLPLWWYVLNWFA